MKGNGERERYTQLNTEFQTITKRDKKVSLNEQYKETEENIGKTLSDINHSKILYGPPPRVWK